MTYGDDLQQKGILKGYNMLLFFAGTMIMYEPSEECITDFWTKGILKMLPVSSSNPTFLKASALLRESCDSKNFCSKKLQEDYTRLFSESDKALAPVYESRNRNDFMPEEKTRISDVTEFYNSYGWVSKFRNKVNDDHLSVELLFLTRLIEKYLDLEDDACRNEMKNEIRRFITQHLFSWVTKWNNKIQLHSTTLSYRGIGALVVACTEDIYSLFEQDSRITFSLNDLKN